jgi:hypothetical protein
MLEITGNDIAFLNDEDLHILIGLLCEAELTSRKLPTSGVTWGGHQDAPDGGVDVRVAIDVPIDGYIPKPQTVYQVKATDMPPSKITEEMRPGGELRQSISELANKKGAYVIVSSADSTSDTYLQERRQAMLKAVSSHENSSDLKLDFYDRGRIASWVRSHPSLILWVREKTGNKLHGWQPYGNWARVPGGIEEEYILDDNIRLYNEADPRAEGKPAIEGMSELRSRLVRPGTSVRLIGLSGVGKTRLLQALFDSRIGDSSLNPSQVFYADMGDSPLPEPRTFAEQIIALQKRAILVVDNCPPDLHRRLSSVCTASGSAVSLITVEYDVREDQPEETEVFRLDPASEVVIEKVIPRRFDHISQIDARTISNFSGGNFKLAIALAETIENSETIVDLRDAELFERLFLQRNERDSTLLKSAEACSLVYSFDCQTEEGNNGELQLLSELSGTSVQQLYADVAELQRRQLVQQRSIWRAVLPHAIANRLAKRALENIPLSAILKKFENSSERLLRSFSRRLSYLHDSGKAREIAAKWLSSDGLLQNIRELNTLGKDILRNIAPIAPHEVLTAIEQASRDEEGQQFLSQADLLGSSEIIRSIAYDAELFDRCVSLLVQCALLEREGGGHRPQNDRLKSLFYLYLSGTHATLEQRKAVVSRLLHSESEREQSLGMVLLGQHWNHHIFHPITLMISGLVHGTSVTRLR